MGVRAPLGGGGGGGEGGGDRFARKNYANVSWFECSYRNLQDVATTNPVALKIVRALSVLR